MIKRSKIMIIVLTILEFLSSCSEDNYSLGELNNIRDFTSSSSTKINKVFEYLPAPGQHINKGVEGTTMKNAIEFAGKNLIYGSTGISLGGFGGYIIVGFDHSVMNIDGKDFMIRGNPFTGPYGTSCEPGIIMVMQDKNNNGIPDDTWYELKGENHDEETTIQNYSITYFRPQNGPGDILWRDSEGSNGQISYIPEFHDQMYYPNWIEKDSYTLTGTLLKHRTVKDTVSGLWSNNAFGAGYADNLGEADDFELGNRFDISNAINSKLEPVNLKYIDFIKIYTAVNIEAGLLGENSTEIFEIKDINPSFN